MTLWLLVPLSMLFLLLSGAARYNGQIAANSRDAAVLRAAADGGIETAIPGLLAGGPALGSDRVAIGTASVGLTIVPLSGMVNPNLASQELIRALLVRAGLAPAQANDVATAVVEWRTPGQRGRDGQDHNTTNQNFARGASRAQIAQFRPIISASTPNPTITGRSTTNSTPTAISPPASAAWTFPT